LNQRKADQEKLRAVETQLNELLTAKKQTEELKLKEQGKYQELVTEREKEIEALRQENLSYKSSFDKAIKLSAFRDQLGGTVDNSAYYDFVNVDKIIVDPDTGVPDMSSVAEVVNEFKQKHSKLYTPKVSRALPNDAPKDNYTYGTPKNKNDYANALRDELSKQFK
jgi:hypothetical protein